MKFNKEYILEMSKKFQDTQVQGMNVPTIVVILEAQTFLRVLPVEDANKFDHVWKKAVIELEEELDQLARLCFIDKYRAIEYIRRVYRERCLTWLKPAPVYHSLTHPEGIFIDALDVSEYNKNVTFEAMTALTYKHPELFTGIVYDSTVEKVVSQSVQFAMNYIDEHYDISDIERMPVRRLVRALFVRIVNVISIAAGKQEYRTSEYQGDYLNMCLDILGYEESEKPRIFNIFLGRDTAITKKIIGGTINKLTERAVV